MSLTTHSDNFYFNGDKIVILPELTSETSARLSVDTSLA
jgi:hypothetical protein